MSLYRTQAIIATADNVPENYATNTWYANCPDMTSVEYWHAELITFYQAIDDAFCNLVRSTDGLELQTYDMEEPEPRAPVLTETANLNPAGGNPLPTEVSLCVSFQAVRQSGEPQARRRGRIYLPFFAEDDNHTDGRPAAAQVTAIAAAAGALLAAGAEAPFYDWVVYSPTQDDYAPVANGWVDNEWDTQRRRGRVRTSRTTFDAS